MPVCLAQSSPTLHGRMGRWTNGQPHKNLNGNADAAESRDFEWLNEQQSWFDDGHFTLGKWKWTLLH